MSDERTHIDVCVATYKRPALLDQLLQSLINQRLDKDVAIRIVVVDNDLAETAREVASRYAEMGITPVCYETEPVQNIALARTRALSACTGDYVAFIDDDEVATQDWLQRLLETSRRFQADVVFGPVVPVYPQNAPEWVRRGRFFERGRMQTGKPCPHGATNNVLISRKTIVATGLQFDQAYGRTGGEDTHFFYRLGQQGARMVWCDDAIVTEEVAENRMTSAWLIRRAYRGGQMYGRLLISPKRLPARIPWIAQRVAYLGVAVALLPLSWLWGKETGVRVLMKISSNLGHLTSQSGWLYEGYR
ncbi:MAG: glycosyltransferase family 2 protein [Nitrospira sp.]|nr:glycosyltransferase [Nitrospira sp.]MDR4476686.1 glycosyltransferase [Nitrospira sp.]